MVLFTSLLMNCSSPRIKIAIDKVQTAASPPELPKVNVYIDGSESMRGYVVAESIPVGRDNKFQRNVSDICINLNQRSKLKSITKIRNGNYVLVDSDDAFYKSLTNGQFFDGSSTEIQDIIPKIIRDVKSNKDEIALFITDGVLSFGSEKSKLDRDYNRKNREQLQTLIANALSENPDISITVIKYSADFDGKYYYNCKELVENSGKVLKKRPFYAVFLGSKEKINLILSSEEILPKCEGVFTTLNPINLKGVLFRKSSKKDELNSILQVNADGSAGSFEKDGKDKVFILALKSSSLPQYISIPKGYFKNLRCDEKYVSVEDCSNNQIFVPKKSKVYKSDYDLFYKVTIEKEILDKNSSITFYFAPTLDIDSSIIDTDFSLNDLSMLEGKTWGLDLITKAIEQTSKKAMGAQITISVFVSDLLTQERNQKRQKENKNN